MVKANDDAVVAKSVTAVVGTAMTGLAYELYCELAEELTLFDVHS